MILCVVDDLMFSMKISTAAKQLQRPIAFERSAAAVVERVRADRPSLVIFDLNSTKLQPFDAISAIKNDPELKTTRTLGYVSHVDAAAIASARAAGVDEVLARSAFVERLGDILSNAS
jgi:CheY-like chemotaxis protein